MGMLQNCVYVAVWSKGDKWPVTFEYNLDNEVIMEISDEISFIPKPRSFAQLIEKISKSFVADTWDREEESPFYLKDTCDEFDKCDNESCALLGFDVLEDGYTFKQLIRGIKARRLSDIYKILLLTDNEGDGCREYCWKWIDFDENTETVSSERIKVSARYREREYREEQLNRIIPEEFGKRKTTPRYNMKNVVQLQNGFFQPICPKCKYKSENQIMLFGDCAESKLSCGNCGKRYDVIISLCEDSSTSCMQDDQKAGERTEEKTSTKRTRPQNGKPERADLGSGVQFDLPFGFDFSNEKGDDGEERIVITYGEYKDEVGETAFKFKCYAELKTDSKNIIEIFKRDTGDFVRCGQLNGKHAVTLCGMGVPISLFGRPINMQDVTAYIDITDDLSICITAHDRIKEEEDTYLYEGMSEVLRAIRIHGEELMLTDLSASVIEGIAGISFDGTRKGSREKSEKKEGERLSSSRSQREQKIEAVKDGLLHASSATAALKIIEGHRDVLQDDLIRKTLSTRMQKIVSCLESEVSSCTEYRERDINRVKLRFSSILNSEYNVESWQKCWEMGYSIIDSTVLKPIRSQLTHLDDPIATFHEIPICLARYVLEKNMEKHRRGEREASIPQIVAYLRTPVVFGDNPPPSADAFNRLLQMRISEFHIGNDFFEVLRKYSGDEAAVRFIRSTLQLDCAKNAEEIESSIAEFKMKQYDEAVLKYNYVVKSRQISEILKESVLSDQGELPDRDTYCSRISQQLTRIEIDSRYVAALHKYLADATVFSFGGEVFAGTENSLNECVDAILQRKMERYDRVAEAIHALSKGKAELTQEKLALEEELLRLGLFAWSRKKKIRMLLEGFPAKEADFEAKGKQAIAAADCF